MQFLGNRADGLKFRSSAVRHRMARGRPADEHGSRSPNRPR